MIAHLFLMMLTDSNASKYVNIKLFLKQKTYSISIKQQFIFCLVTYQVIQRSGHNIFSDKQKTFIVKIHDLQYFSLSNLNRWLKTFTKNIQKVKIYYLKVYPRFYIIIYNNYVWSLLIIVFCLSAYF